jgi:hypothetical protein
MRRGAIIGRMHADAFSQGISERDWAAMLPEDIAEGFLGKILEPLAGLKAELIERVPVTGCVQVMVCLVILRLVTSTGAAG